MLKRTLGAAPSLPVFAVYLEDFFVSAGAVTCATRPLAKTASAIMTKKRAP